MSSHYPAAGPSPPEYGGSNSGRQTKLQPSTSTCPHNHTSIKQEPVAESDTISIDTRSIASSGIPACGCRHVSDDYPKPVPDAPAFPVLALPFHLALQQSMNQGQWSHHPHPSTSYDPNNADSNTNAESSSWQGTQFQPTWVWNNTTGGISSSQHLYYWPYEAIPYGSGHPVVEPNTSAAYPSYTHAVHATSIPTEEPEGIAEEEWKAYFAATRSA